MDLDRLRRDAALRRDRGGWRRDGHRSRALPRRARPRRLAAGTLLDRSRSRKLRWPHPHLPPDLRGPRVRPDGEGGTRAVARTRGRGRRDAARHDRRARRRGRRTHLRGGAARRGRGVPLPHSRGRRGALAAPAVRAGERDLRATLRRCRSGGEHAAGAGADRTRARGEHPRGHGRRTDRSGRGRRRDRDGGRDLPCSCGRDRGRTVGRTSAGRRGPGAAAAAELRAGDLLPRGRAGGAPHGDRLDGEPTVHPLPGARPVRTRCVQGGLAHVRAIRRPGSPVVRAGPRPRPEGVRLHLGSGSGLEPHGTHPYLPLYEHPGRGLRPGPDRATRDRLALQRPRFQVHPVDRRAARRSRDRSSAPGVDLGRFSAARPALRT